MYLNNIFKFISIYLIITGILFLLGGPVYLVTSLIALIIISILQFNKSGVLKMTRWANANTAKAQIFITFLQLILLSVGIYAGYNFKNLGIEFSNSTVLIFGLIIFVSFLLIPFLPKRRMIVLPGNVSRNRLAYVLIALSSFVLMVITGNRLDDKYPKSIVTNTVKEFDNSLFPVETPIYVNHDNIDYNINLASEGSVNAKFVSHLYNEKATPPDVLKKDLLLKLKAEKKAEKLEKKNEKKLKRVEKYRKLLAAGLTAGAIILIILLGVLTCAGICMIIAGFSGSAGLIPLGILVAGGSIFGIVKISQGGRRTTPENNNR
jgi:hypothetical protein